MPAAGGSDAAQDCLWFDAEPEEGVTDEAAPSDEVVMVASEVDVDSDPLRHLPTVGRDPARENARREVAREVSQHFRVWKTSPGRRPVARIRTVASCRRVVRTAWAEQPDGRIEVRLCRAEHLEPFGRRVARLRLAGSGQEGDAVDDGGPDYCFGHGDFFRYDWDGCSRSIRYQSKSNQSISIEAFRFCADKQQRELGRVPFVTLRGAFSTIQPRRP